MNKRQLLCGISVLFFSLGMIAAQEDIMQDVADEITEVTEDIIDEEIALDTSNEQDEEALPVDGDQIDEVGLRQQATPDILDEETNDALFGEDDQSNGVGVNEQVPDEDGQIEPESIDQLDVDEDLQTQIEEVAQDADQEVIEKELDSVAVSSDNEEIVVPETALEREEIISEEQDERDISLELSEPLGIDTVDLSEPQGNWLFKRVWWERAEERYEKINQLVQKMMEMRVNFFVKRADIDKNILDPFYLNIGMGHAELLVTLTTLIEQIEKEREEEGVLTYDQRELLETLEQEREVVATLQKDAEAIQELDHSVDAALAKLIEIMNEMRQHERNAWVNFKEIARVLSEKKARELFYNIDASWQHIKKLRDYLEKDFGPYFAKLAQSVNEHIEVVKKQIDTLQEKGLSLKESVDVLTQEKKTLSYDYDDEEDEDEPVQTSWLGWIGDFFWSIITFPVTLFKMIFG